MLCGRSTCPSLRIPVASVDNTVAIYYNIRQRRPRWHNVCLCVGWCWLWPYALFLSLPLLLSFSFPVRLCLIHCRAMAASKPMIYMHGSAALYTARLRSYMYIYDRERRSGVQSWCVRVSVFWCRRCCCCVRPSSTHAMPFISHSTIHLFLLLLAPCGWVHVRHTLCRCRAVATFVRITLFGTFWQCM